MVLTKPLEEDVTLRNGNLLESDWSNQWLTSVTVTQEDVRLPGCRVEFDARKWTLPRGVAGVLFRRFSVWPSLEIPV